MPQLEHAGVGEFAAGLRGWAEPDEEVGSEGLDLARLDAALIDLDAWLAATSLLPDEAVRGELRAQGAMLRQRRDELLAPLQIAIVGGTGVGKSTVLNAFAGETIAEASAVRPCTRQVTIYAHQDNRAALDPAWAPPDRIRLHERPELRNKILIDTPDIDSLAGEHRRRTEAAVASADLVLFVVTAQKYADLAGAQWLARFAAGRRFVFLLNRADEGLDAAVVADLAGRLAAAGFDHADIRRVSAAGALAAKLGEAGEGHEFGEVERLVAESLDAKRMRQVKESNLAAAVARWVRHVDEALPDQLADRLAAWRAGAAEAYAELRVELVAQLYPTLRDDARLARHVEYWFGTGFGGPTGVCLTVLYALRAAVAPDYPRLWEVSEAPAVELASPADAAAAIGERVASAQARLRALATYNGLPGGPATLPEPAHLATRSVVQPIDDRLRGELGRALRAARDERSLGQRVLALVLNVPALALLLGLPGYWLWDRLQALTGDAVLPTGEYFQAAAIVVALWLWLATWLAQLMIRRRTRRFLANLRDRVGAAVDEVLRPKLLGRLEARLDELAGEQTRWARLVEPGWLRPR